MPATKTVKLVTYWPPIGELAAAIIRHSSPADVEYLIACQAKLNLPSACVWMVPGTED